MRKLLSTAAAILLAGGVAYSASIPLQSGPYDPGNAQGTLNQVITNTVFGVEGLLGYVNGPVGSSSLTTPQFFAQTTVNTGQLLTGGQGLRVACAGEAAASAAQKNLFLSIGNAGEVTAGAGLGSPGVIASSAFGGVTATAWTIKMDFQVGNTVATLGSAATPNSFNGFTLIPGSTTSSFVWVGPDTTDNIATGLTIQCGYETINKADMTMQSFTVEQIK